MRIWLFAAMPIILSLGVSMEVAVVRAQTPRPPSIGS